MNETVISLPDDVAALVEEEARRRNASATETVCAILSEHLPRPGRPTADHATRPVPFAGLFRDERMVNATDIDAYLEKHWAADIGRDSR